MIDENYHPRIIKQVKIIFERYRKIIKEEMIQEKYL